MFRHFIIGVLLFITTGCAHLQRSPHGEIVGPKRTVVPLFRNTGTQNKLFIEVQLEDGTPRLFLLDTGSSLSMVSKQVAIELNLTLRSRATNLSGYGGTTNWVSGRLASMKLGAFTLADVSVAVGIEGVPSHVGMVPLDGLIGNDILSQFQVEVDYPGQTLSLSRPGTVPVPPHAVPLFYNGQHALAQANLTARNEAGLTVQQHALLAIDTGATGLMLVGPSPGGLADVATQGVETMVIKGAGGQAGMQRPTRRLSIARTTIGGQTISVPVMATWIQFDQPRRAHTPEMPGFVGHTVLSNFRVTLDYQAKRFALSPADKATPAVDVHEWFMKRGSASKDPLEKVRSLFIIGRKEEARRRLNRLALNPGSFPGAVALLSRIERREGKHQSASERLSNLPIRDLVETGELGAFVNSLWLSGDFGEAITQAKTATVLEPDSPEAWISLADASLAKGESGKAREAMAKAIELEGNPDGHRVRRAVIALIDGDVDGALTHLRRRVRKNPGDGYAQWLYARTATGPGRVDLVSSDLRRAETRLHPGDGPLDFLAGAWHHLLDTQHAQELMSEGLARDCRPASTEASKLNCEAWYQGLVNHQLADAEEKVTSALKVYPARAEFLDTLALILEAKGDLPGASQAAWTAAMNSPDDVYLFTQALRIKAQLPPDGE